MLMACGENVECHVGVISNFLCVEYFCFPCKKLQFDFSVSDDMNLMCVHVSVFTRYERIGTNNKIKYY
jgi:hypothetical protein